MLMGYRLIKCQRNECLSNLLKTNTLRHNETQIHKRYNHIDVNFEIFLRIELKTQSKDRFLKSIEASWYLHEPLD